MKMNYVQQNYSNVFHKDYIRITLRILSPKQILRHNKQEGSTFFKFHCIQPDISVECDLPNGGMSSSYRTSKIRILTTPVIVNLRRNLKKCMNMCTVNFMHKVSYVKLQKRHYLRVSDRKPQKMSNFRHCNGSLFY